MSLKSFGKALVRRKKIDDDQEPSTLNRCLGTWDLTALGIGSTLGLGMYVIAGKVASSEAGPAVVLSFFFAALASVFAGFCYAEFGARVPKAGSAYIYSYVTVGEFIAFVIGWNLILEYVIGTASVARGYSGYLDSLFNGTIAHHLQEWMPIGISHISAYPDLLALGITLLLTIMLAIGVKESTRFNSVFTLVNLSIVIFVIVCGSFKVDFKNWKIPESSVPSGGGSGGFLPFGFSGVMKGAATCFYSFVGFDIIATTGEEVRNPQKAIPISIVASLFVSFLAYFGVSSIQTLMWPYYDLNQNAPLPYVFDQTGFHFAKWIITIGALAGLSTSLMGAMFPLPRVLYAMASDGLIFRSLAKVNEKTQTPLLATIISGIFSGSMAALFDVNELADMMSIGTLLAYTLVAVAILILRHESGSENSIRNRVISSSQEALINQDNIPESSNQPRSVGVSQITGNFFRSLLNLEKLDKPDAQTSFFSKLLILSICINVLILDLLLVILEKNLTHLETISLIVTGLSIFYLFLLTIALVRQPKSSATISFQVPLVPFLPIISIFINTYLMMKLPVVTWIRFAVWMIIGLAIYVFYALRNSTGYMSYSERCQVLGINETTNDGYSESRPNSPDREEHPLLS